MKKVLSLLLSLAMVFTTVVPAFASNGTTTSEIERLVNIALEERAQFGEASDDTIKALESALNDVGVEIGSYSGTHAIEVNTISPYGYGETHDLGRGWSYRVDKPSANDAKPHVHVDNDKLGIHGVENVDGTPSHGNTLDGAKVPKNVQKKVKGSKDYKKGQEDLKKMQEAKEEITRQNLDLTIQTDLIIAAGIFVAVVGVAFFAPEFLPGVLAVI